MSGSTDSPKRPRCSQCSTSITPHEDGLCHTLCMACLFVEQPKHFLTKQEKSKCQVCSAVAPRSFREQRRRSLASLASASPTLLSAEETKALDKVFTASGTSLVSMFNERLPPFDYDSSDAEEEDVSDQVPVGTIENVSDRDQPQHDSVRAESPSGHLSSLASQVSIYVEEEESLPDSKENSVAGSEPAGAGDVKTPEQSEGEGLAAVVIDPILASPDIDAIFPKAKGESCDGEVTGGSQGVPSPVPNVFLKPAPGLPFPDMVNINVLQKGGAEVASAVAEWLKSLRGSLNQA